MDWIHPTEDRNQWGAVVNVVINLQIVQNGDILD
jgi:hypothetical protein